MTTLGERYSEFFEPHCIACGDLEKRGVALIQGESHDLHWSLHPGKCEETYRQVKALAMRTLFRDVEDWRDSIRALRLEPSVGGSVVLLGAGASIPVGVPGFERLMREIAERVGTPISAQDLVDSLDTDGEIFAEATAVFGGYAGHAKPGYAHFSLVEEMLAGNFLAVVTTNWDLLLERAWTDVIEAVGISKGPLPGLGRNPRLRVVIDDRDVVNLDAQQPGLPYADTVFKIHGSPLAYYCPDCSGIQRFRFLDVVVHGRLACLRHPSTVVRPYAMISDTTVDRATPHLLDSIGMLFEAARNIIVIGYSGRDDYLFGRLLAPHRGKVWTVAPAAIASSDPTWNLAPTHQRIDATATAFFRLWVAICHWRFPGAFSQFGLQGVFTTLVERGQLCIQDELAATLHYHQSLTWWWLRQQRDP